MKKINLIVSLVALLIIFGFINSNTIAQTLYFCEGVDSDGYPENESSKFTIPSGGGYLYFLVRMPDGVDTYNIKYLIYRVKSNGDEKYETTIEQDVEPQWTYFWKKITFYEKGKYNIYVYDDDDNFITSGTLRIDTK
jgi:hypothetical protein